MIEIVDTDCGLAALAPEWQALWDGSGASAFAAPRWLLPWWQQFGTGQPRVVTRRRNGRLAGLLPLYILPAERKALPMGAGTTDALDALGEADGLLEAGLRRLAADGIGRCDLIDVPPGSALIGAEAAGWRGIWRQGATCPVLTLPDIPHRMRRNIALARNRAARAGGFCVETAEASGFDRFFEGLIALHQARWCELGEPGVLADPAVVAFWRAAGPGLEAAGLLRAQTLWIGGRRAAAIAALLAPGRICFYLSGFDTGLAALSPGTLLFAALIEQAIGEGRSEAHFLRGGEAYKYRWGALDRFNADGNYEWTADRVSTLSE